MLQDTTDDTGLKTFDGTDRSMDVPKGARGLGSNGAAGMLTWFP